MVFGSKETYNCIEIDQESKFGIKVNEYMGWLKVSPLSGRFVKYA